MATGCLGSGSELRAWQPLLLCSKVVTGSGAEADCSHFLQQQEGTQLCPPNCPPTGCSAGTGHKSLCKTAP